MERPSHWLSSTGLFRFQPISIKWGWLSVKSVLQPTWLPICSPSHCSSSRTTTWYGLQNTRLETCILNFYLICTCYLEVIFGKGVGVGSVIPIFWCFICSINKSAANLITLTTLQISTACYRESFTLWRRSVLPVRYELDCKYCYK
jgi:hypothetical protein